MFPYMAGVFLETTPPLRCLCVHRYDSISPFQFCVELNQGTLGSVRRWRQPRGLWKSIVSENPSTHVDAVHMLLTVVSRDRGAVHSVPQLIISWGVCLWEHHQICASTFSGHSQKRSASKLIFLMQNRLEGIFFAGICAD